MSYVCLDIEPAEFYSEKLYTARKTHKCCETGRIIQPGEKYWRCTGKWEGELMTFVQSDFAYRFARKINGVEPPNETLQREGCVCFGGVGEYVDEMRRDMPPEWLAEWEAELAKAVKP